MEWQGRVAALAEEEAEDQIFAHGFKSGVVILDTSSHLPKQLCCVGVLWSESATQCEADANVC